MDWPARVALGVIALGCAVVLREARGTTFLQDEWSFILFRRGLSTGVFLRPHANHLSVLPVAAYELLFATFGLGTYLPYLLLLVALHAVTCLLLYVLLRRYMGPWVAIAPVAIMVVLGPAWHDLLWAFQIGYLGSAAAGLGMTLCLERQDRRGDIAASGLLLVSLMFSSVFIPFAALGTVLILLQRPREWCRLWVIGAPLALYGLWYAGYGVSSFRAADVPMVPGYLWHAFAAAISSVTGFAGGTSVTYLVSVAHGELLAGEGLVLLILRIVWRRGAPPLTWAACAAALALWTAQVLNYTPARQAAQSRYQYTAALLVLIVAGSASRGWRPGRASLAALAAVTAAICASNLVLFSRDAGPWRVVAQYQRAELAALELGGNLVAPDFSLNATLRATLRPAPPPFVLAANYFSAVAALGSPADTPDELVKEPEAVRETVDLVLGREERIHPALMPGRPQVGGACPSSGPALGGRPVAFGALVIRNRDSTPIVLELRRYAGAFHFLRWAIEPNVTEVLVLPKDGSGVKWRVACEP